MLLAQAAGGAIKRPVKKPASKTNTAKQRTGSSKMNRDRILQNLINNMVYVEGGSFMMGATADMGSWFEKRERPVHRVNISSYNIGKYEVTQEEWQAVMGTNPSYFKGAKRPVEHVSWNECQEFIRKLNMLTGKWFRLPTEAEWEFAARGGKHSRGYKYAGSNDIDEVAWINKGDGHSKTRPVGQKQPNELGLYDMSGNVYEYCQDRFGNYDSSEQTNPVGSETDPRRIIRGGSYLGHEGFCRPSYREVCQPDEKYYGLRLAL